MKSKLKIIAMLVVICIPIGLFTACGNNTDTNDEVTQAEVNNDANPAENNVEDEQPEDAEIPQTISGAIAPITREEGSGTRGAFVELFDVQIEVGGKKIDDIRPTAQVQNSTGSVIAAIQGNRQAIGYISLGSLDENVRALNIDGVEATADNILNDSYKIARPFNIVYKDGLSAEAQDFVDFIMSDEGQEILVSKGYISTESTGAYQGGGVSGKITLDGSSSISPVMQNLIEAYKDLNPDAIVELQSTSSGVGITSTVDDGCDIGMVSREVKQEELDQGLTSLTICMDGIAVIVNKDNPIENMSSEIIKEIFGDGGSITKWEEIS